MKKIAIVGSGIAGFASAYYLSSTDQITIFEKEDRLGGHVDTHQVRDPSGNLLSIDTGYIMFSEAKYPRFVAFLRDLKVIYKKSKMSFCVDDHSRGKTLFGASFFMSVLQSKSCFTITYWHLVLDGIKMRNLALKTQGDICTKMTIDEFMNLHHFSEAFREEYFLIMAAGLMSTSVEAVRHYPMNRLLNFLINHGLICFLPPLSWCYVENGYDTYLKKVLEQLNVTLRLSTPVQSIKRVGTKAQVQTKDGVVEFDAVIMACEADTALKLQASPTNLEKEILEAFKYNLNAGLLHTDEAIMPQNKKRWGGHTVHVNEDKTKGCFTIWLNPILQLPSTHNYFLTLNPWMQIDPGKVVKEVRYRHLIVSSEVLQKQPSLPKLNEAGPVYFVGGYFKYFHEDAMNSAFQVAQKL